MSETSASNAATPRDTVADAINMVINELGIGSERDNDLLSLVRNAIHTRMENPDASFDDVVNASLEVIPEEVRGWWSNWDRPVTLAT